MLKIIAQNRFGKIVMSNTPLTDFMISSYDGLDYISPEYTTETYAGENGKKTVHKYVPGRVITLQLSIKNYDRVDMETAIMVLTEEVDLIIQNGAKVRRIKAKCTSFEKGEINPVIAIRSLQFDCDDVNFSDLHPTQAVLFDKQNQLTDSFTLPMIPTELVTEKDVFNIGYLLVQPVIVIENTAAINTTQPEEYGFEILNETYNQKIRLNYHTSVGEVVKIDVYNRKITSTLNGTVTNLLNYISDDTDLESFFFAVGANHIKFNNYNAQENLTAYAEYSNLWIEVM